MKSLPRCFKLLSFRFQPTLSDHTIARKVAPSVRTANLWASGLCIYESLQTIVPFFT
jgi:hypothetical protein